MPEQMLKNFLLELKILLKRSNFATALKIIALEMRLEVYLKQSSFYDDIHDDSADDKFWN